MVTRVGEVYLDKSTDMVFPDLPGALEDASVRIKGAGLRIGEVQVKKGYRKEPHPRVRALQEEIKVIEIEDRTLSDELLVLRDKEKFLQTIAVGGPEMVSKEIMMGKVSPQAWRQGLKFMVDELLSTKARQAEIERHRTDLREKINALQHELNDIRSNVENRKAVTFDAHPETARNYDIKLSYILRGAGWRTYYELRAHPATGNADFSYFSKINQRTGEDWVNTKIVLSTAQPALGGSAPTPLPWHIELRSLHKPAYEQKIEGEKIAVGGVTSVTPARAAPPIEAGISIWYPLPGRYTLRSGDPEKKVQIYETSLNTRFEYFIIPRVVQHAYSTGKFLNTTNYLFLAGEAGTYVGDDFTGTTSLPTITPEESTTVSFGIDERVRVKREMKKVKVSKGGFFTKTTKHEFTYENSVENFHDKQIQCTIVDQVPISQDPDIKVHKLEFDPKPIEEDKDRGIYYWKVGLKPYEKYAITVSFTVEAPGKREIEGLMP